jgi:MFS family permease
VNPEGGVFAPARRALSVGILLSITAIACEGMAVATVMPSAALELGGLDFYGWAFSAFMLTSLVGAISAGQAADRGDAVGPARLGLACFALGLVVGGVAPAWPILLIGRGAQGFGSGSLGAIAYVAVARGYPPALRPRLLALLASAWVLPALVGPAIAGQVAEHVSWRAVFIGILPAVALGAWMLLPALAELPEATPESTRRVSPDALGDVPTAAHDGMAPVTLLRGAVRQKTPPVRVLAWLSASTASSRVWASVRLAFAVGLVLLATNLQLLLATLIVGALGVVLAVPSLKALLPAGTFTIRQGLPAAVALRGLLAFGFFGCETLIPLGLTTQRNLPPSLVGFSLTASALTWVLASWIQDRAESWSAGSLTQRALRVGVGLVLIAVGISCVGVVVLSPGVPIAFGVVAWGVAGLGMGLTYPASTLTALGLAPSGGEGSAAASLQVAETVCVAVGAGAMGSLVALAGHLERSMSDGLAWGFLLGALVIVVALGPAARLAPILWWPTLRRPRAVRRSPSSS